MDQSELVDQLESAIRSSDGRFAMRPESTFILSESRTRVDDARDPVVELLNDSTHKLAELLRHASQGSARHALQAIPLLRERVDELEREAVIVARS